MRNENITNWITKNVITRITIGRKYKHISLDIKSGNMVVKSINIDYSKINKDLTNKILPKNFDRIDVILDGNNKLLSYEMIKFLTEDAAEKLGFDKVEFLNDSSYKSERMGKWMLRQTQDNAYWWNQCTNSFDDSTLPKIKNRMKVLEFDPIDINNLIDAIFKIHEESKD